VATIFLTGVDRHSKVATTQCEQLYATMFKILATTSKILATMGKILPSCYLRLAAASYYVISTTWTVTPLSASANNKNK